MLHILQHTPGPFLMWTLLVITAGIISIGLLFRAHTHLKNSLKDIIQGLAHLMKHGIQSFQPFSIKYTESSVNTSTEIKLALNEVLLKFKNERQNNQDTLIQSQNITTLVSTQSITLKNYLHITSLCLSSLGFGIRLLNRSGSILFENDMFHKLSAPFGDSLTSTLQLAIRNISDNRAENSYFLRHRNMSIQAQIFPLHLPENTSLTPHLDGILIVIEDCTSKEEMRSKLIENERWSAIGEMSAQVSHEIRNPLNAINMNLEMLKEDLESLTSLPSNIPKLLQATFRQTERLLALSDQYLKLHRMFEPAMAFDPTPVIHDVISTLAPLAHVKGIPLIIRQKAPPTILEGDMQAMYTIVQNVIQNALDSMKTGGRIILLTRLSPDGRFILKIKDEGSGIPVHLRSQIFQPFFTTKKEGTGLGLALVKRATEHLKGSCQLSCGKTTRGVMFSFQFPVRPSPSIQVSL